AQQVIEKRTTINMPEEVPAGVPPSPVNHHVLLLPFPIDPPGFPADQCVPLRCKAAIPAKGVILGRDGVPLIPVVVIPCPAGPREVHKMIYLRHAVAQVP